MPTRTSSLIAARSGTRHLDLVARADLLGERADRALARAWNELVRLLNKPPAYFMLRSALRAALTRVQTALRDELQRGLEKLARQGHRDAADVLVGAIPLDTLADRVTLREDKEPPRKAGIRFRTQAGQLKIEPAIGGSKAHRKRLLKQLLFDPPTQQQVRDVLRRPVLGSNWEQDLSQASKLAGFDPDAMASAMAIGFSLGKNPRELARDILPAVDHVRTSARRIARTYGVQVARRMQMNAHAQLGDLVIGYQIHSAFSPHSREWHKERDGTVYYIRPGPGQKGLAQMPNPPLEAEDPRERPPGAPKMAWNCILPGSMVQGRFLAASKSFYFGQACEIRSSSGFLLRLTTNHPVLTDKGFVAAGALRKGDCLVSYIGGISEFAQHEENRPSPVEDVFRSIKQFSGVISYTPTVGEFHGDARLFQGDVEVVFAKGKLATRHDANLPERLAQCELVGSGGHEPFMSGFGSGEFGGFRVNAPTGCLVSSSHPLSPLGQTDTVELVPLCLGGAAQLDVGLRKHAVQSTGWLGSDGGVTTRDTELFSELVHRFPGKVSPDHIVDVRHFDFRGHVYDLHSSGGWIVADNIFISNCLCWISPVLREEDTPAPKTADNKLIPDLSTFVRWFAHADEKRQKLAVGVRRYETVAAEVGEPEWIHFVDPDTGQLLSRDALKRESAGEREERMERVREMMLAEVS